MIDHIKQKIEAAFSGYKIDKLEVVDESHLHAGHAGLDDWRASRGRDTTTITHLRINIISDRFASMKTIAKHKLLNQLLSAEIRALHSVTFCLESPFDPEK